VVFHGERNGNRKGVVGLYQTKAEADAVAQEGHQCFVLPPVSAWMGKCWSS
jgi:hypothetical protein